MRCQFVNTCNVVSVANMCHEKSVMVNLMSPWCAFTLEDMDAAEECAKSMSSFNSDGFVFCLFLVLTLVYFNPFFTVLGHQVKRV